ncbi:MAG: ABC-type transport auxiliary lipoprotein family protein [Pseudomonadota bacterium]|nr:ABC-type transport auxiliary lipoprotein family protein [Pseudomonadota bacterium]
MGRWTWLALFGLAGCTALPSPPAAIHTYLFSAPFPAPRRGPGPVLLIAIPKAAAGYDRPAIAYRRSPTRLDYYAANEWADEPARLIEPLIIAATEASGAFEAVVSAGTGLTAEIRLDTEIVRIEHELLAAPSRGRFTLRAQLVDVARGRVIGTQRFDASVPSRSDDAEGAVAAIDTALARVLVQLVAFCLKNTVDREKRGGP